MTRASTRRLRFVYGLMAIALLAVALTDGRALQGHVGLLAQAAGFLLVVAGTLWRMWTTVFIAGRKEVEVVHVGPYGRCRHPLYFGSLLGGLGIGLTTRSLLLTAGIAVTLGAATWMAIRREEADLAARHGAVWERYRGRLPALVPRLGPVPLPRRREVELPVYRKAFLDAFATLVFWLLVVVVDALRSQLAWRTFFPLP